MIVGDKVLVVHSPEIGGSKFDGQEVYVHGFYKSLVHKDYVKVLTKGGYEIVLHKSQIKELAK